MDGGSGMSCKVGGGVGGKSVGIAGVFCERCEPNRLSRERCFCFMSLEMMKGGEGGAL